MASSRLASIASFALVSLLGACQPNTTFVTPLAPVTSVFDPGCPVAYTTDTAPAGTRTLGIVKCLHTGSGETCGVLARRDACAMGGDIVYGLHWEPPVTGRGPLFVVGTIGRTPAAGGT